MLTDGCSTCVHIHCSFDFDWLNIISLTQHEHTYFLLRMLWRKKPYNDFTVVGLENVIKTYWNISQECMQNQDNGNKYIFEIAACELFLIIALFRHINARFWHKNPWFDTQMPGVTHKCPTQHSSVAIAIIKHPPPPPPPPTEKFYSNILL